MTGGALLFFLPQSVKKMFAVHPQQQLKELYFFSLLFSFASALITIFEPVFLYQESFPLWKIAMYYAVHYSIYAFTLPLAGKFVSRFGSERSLAISTPLFVLYFLSLAALPVWPQLFWVALVLLTAHKTFYWPAFHNLFARFTDGENSGTEISWMNVIVSGVGILGPLIGGVVASQFGFPVLFILAAVLVMGANIPLLRTKERYKQKTFSYLDPWRIVVSKTHRRMTIAMIGMGENLIDLIVWPVFMFIVLGGVDSLGYLASFTVLLMTLLGFFVGEVSDRFPKKIILRLHLPFMAIGYLMRPFAGTPMRVLLTDSLARAAYIGIRIPMIAILYNGGKKVGALRYSIAFELALVVVKALTAWVLVFVFAAFLPFTAFTISFVIAAVMVGFYAALK